MVQFLMECIYCQHPYTYRLKNNQRKCSKCKRKFSLAKQARIKVLLEHFEQSHTAQYAAEQSQMHIATVLKYYEQFRKRIVHLCEAYYTQHSHLVTDYDEYLYLPKTLDPQSDIHKVKHFLTLAYDGRVYTLMMPSITRLGLDLNDKSEQKLLTKYLQYRTISNLSTERSTIRRFWEYFESFILKYKGVSDAHFVYYLKEAEWRFNQMQRYLFPSSFIR